MLQFITVNMLFNDFVQYKNSEPFITVKNDEIKHLQFFNCPKKMVSNGFIMFKTGAPLQPPFICYSLLQKASYQRHFNVIGKAYTQYAHAAAAALFACNL